MIKTNFYLSGLGPFSAVIPELIAIAFVVLHILFMCCIMNDAKRLQQGGRSTAVLTPFAWGLAAALLGLMAVALYWVAHYSTFARKDGPAAT